jgi:hypothetical protein
MRERARVCAPVIVVSVCARACLVCVRVCACFSSFGLLSFPCSDVSDGLLTPLRCSGMGLPAVIPQSVLFGNPDKAEPKLSPDGTQYAYLANSEKGVLNVFVQKVGEDKAKQVTNDTHRGIRMFEWAKNNKSVLYLQDADGDENWHVYAADLSTGVVRDMTPFQGIRADDLHTDQAFPNEAIVGLNIRDRAAFDLYRLDLVTGALVMYTENPGNVNQWICDADFKIRGAVANDQNDGSKILKVRDSDTSEWRAIASWPNDETAQFHRFTQDGTGIYVATSMAHGKGDAKDTTRLVVLSASDGSEKEEVFYDARCDVDEVIFNDADHVVEAVVVDYSQQEWVVQHSRVQADIDALKTVCTGTLRITSRSTDDTAWIVADMRDDGSVGTCLREWVEGVGVRGTAARVLLRVVPCV